jgi:hypothetical protein
MSQISKQQLARFRSEILEILDLIKAVSFKVVHSSPLIYATPGEVLRKCGKTSCACASDDNKRHGPYKVLQIYRDGKQRQVSLGKEASETWEQAKVYQHQIANLQEVKDLHGRLQDLLKKVVSMRTIEFEK